MKKVVRLTESDLIHFIKKIIKEGGYYDNDKFSNISSAQHLRGKGHHIDFELGDVVNTVNDFYHNEIPGQIIDLFNDGEGNVIYGVRFFKENGTTSVGKYSPDELQRMNKIPSYVYDNEKFIN